MSENHIQTIQKLNTTQKMQTTQNTAKQNYPGSVTSYDTWPRNEVGLFYKAPEPTRGHFTNRLYTTVMQHYIPQFKCTRHRDEVTLHQICTTTATLSISQAGHSPVMIKFPDCSRHFKWIFMEYRPL